MTASSRLDPALLEAITRAVADEVARQVGPALRGLLGAQRATPEDPGQLDEAIRAGEVAVVGEGPRLRFLPNTIEEDLEAFNELAREELDAGHPPPSDCPPPGVWLRCVRHALSERSFGRAFPKGPWHMSMGWDGHWGQLRTRCGHPRNLWADNRPQLLISVPLPRGEVCRACLRFLAHELS